MKKFLIGILAVACLAVLIMASPSLSRLAGWQIFPEIPSAPPATQNTIKGYNVSNVFYLIDEDGNTIAISTSGVSKNVTTISSDTELTATGNYHITGTRIITLYNPADNVGRISRFTGTETGVSLWMTQGGSINSTGTAAGATLYTTSAPWWVDIYHPTGTCTFARSSPGSIGILPE